MPAILLDRHRHFLDWAAFGYAALALIFLEMANEGLRWYSRNRSSLCLLFVKLALLFVFSSFIRRRPIPYARASRKLAFDASGSAKPEPQLRRAVRRCECLAKEPSVTNPSIAKDSQGSCGYATVNCAIFLKYELLRVSAGRQFVSVRRQIGTGIFFGSNLCGLRSKFAWALPLSLSSSGTNIFLKNDKYGGEVKISSKCPTASIASSHVKYVKGC